MRRETMNTPMSNKVDIDITSPTGAHHFLVIRIGNPRSGSLVILAKEGVKYHQDIYDSYLANHPKENVYVQGGGFMSVDKKEKVIRLWSESGKFGKEPDRENTTVPAIQEHYPDFQVLANYDALFPPEPEDSE